MTTPNRPSNPSGLSLAEAIEAQRAGRSVVETLPNGATRRVNFAKRGKKALLKQHGLSSARQWRKLQRQLRAARRGEGPS